MTRDPVCGLYLEQYDASAISDLHGTSYYFCSVQCRMAFDRTPDAYVRPVPA